MVLSNQDPNYRQCSISVMDNIADPDIKFDDKGICNYYYEYLKAEKEQVKKGVEGEKEFKAIIQKIKEDGKGKEYDCILGVSGGVDSTYLAYIAAQQGLRVLCVHFDNGWNSELAVQNIENIVSKCGFQLYTYVIDWNEFKDIQRSYFKANVIDIEAVTDIAIFSALDILCKQFKIKHIIDGRNVVTEVTLPPAWICKNSANLKDIQKKFGTLKLKSYPLMNIIRRRVVARTKPFTSWPILNYIPYEKSEAKKTIIEKLNWRDYGGKHYESVFTRFYQGYILPEKFKVDKRKAHLSNLIFSGQITKEEALEELKQPIYPQELFTTDYEFAIKKLGFTHEEFQAYLKAPQVPHSNFEMSNSIFDEVPALKPFRKIFNK
ncbi:N-acetyl sugar amidotransferase [Ferruginibacter sp. SUN002]|uniref:N-acetyl sugar amidotransferase n=1 Tax=Ferruginibacter sp. SUN002 TaxID=2937789 RepID=UPI003D36182C